MFGEKRGNNEEEVISADLADELDGKYKGDEGDEGEEDEDEDEDDDDEEVAELLEKSVAVGDQVYMVAGEDEDDGRRRESSFPKVGLHPSASLELSVIK